MREDDFVEVICDWNNFHFPSFTIIFCIIIRYIIHYIYDHKF